MFSLTARTIDLLYWTCYTCGARVGNGDWHTCGAKPVVMQGWQCPKCRRVWGPQVKECARCNQQEETQV